MAGQLEVRLSSKQTAWLAILHEPPEFQTPGIGEAFIITPKARAHPWGKWSSLFHTFNGADSKNPENPRYDTDQVPWGLWLFPAPVSTYQH